MKKDTHKPRLYLWEDRTLFIGQYDKPIVVSTGAATLMLALNKPIRFQTKDMKRSIACRSLLIPAGTPVIFNFSDGVVCNCTLEPAGYDFNRISQVMTQTEGCALYQLENEKALIKKCQQAYLSPVNEKDLLALVHELIQLKHSHTNTIPPHTTSQHYALDPRAKEIIEVIQTTISENITLSELANKANMSPSRLVQIFKQQTGLPVRRYRLWYRLYTTAFAVAQGMNLTDAAVSAGFTDSSHFNRTVRSMLNIKPSYIFSSSNPVRILESIPERAIESA